MRIEESLFDKVNIGSTHPHDFIVTAMETHLKLGEIQDYQSLKEKYESQGHLDGLKIIKQFDNNKYFRTVYKCLICNTEFNYDLPSSKDEWIIY